MKNEVVDCSVLVKLFVPEKGSQDAICWCKNWRNGKIEVFAPELVIAEFANVIWHKVWRKEIDPSIGSSSVADFMKLPIRIVEHGTLIEGAFNMAISHEITVYDALYAALAYKLDATLVTADNILAKKLKPSPVVCRTI